MQTFLLIVAVALFLILVLLVLRDIISSAFIKNNWPKELSLETKIETWLLYSVAGIEYYRVRQSSKLLCNYIHFFLSGYKVPPECGKDNPVVSVFDFTVGKLNEKIMSKNSFVNNYSKFLSFESFKEYKKYINTLD